MVEEPSTVTTGAHVDDDDQQNDHLAEGDIAIQVKGVTKRFGSNTAVDDVSFDVRKGEVVGFLGPNGSGKTTTMRLLTSFYTPDSGSISIEGIDNQQRDVETRRMIGYLPENNPIYGDLLVREYLAFVADLRGLSGAERRSNIEQAISETGIGEVYYRPINQCSKGFKQRVGLAQAILHRPEILIMDEPTEGLDPNQRVTIREEIKQIGSARTVLLSTHVLQEVEATCSRLLIIGRGKILANGTAHELRANARKGRYIGLEVEGEAVEATLGRLNTIESVELRTPIGNRQRYILSVTGEDDPRPEIFQIAKKQGWVIWDLHDEIPRLEDLFYSLTSEQNTET